MTGEIKKFVTIIMDGSNLNKVIDIHNTHEEIVRHLDENCNVKISCQILNDNHPTMVVVEVYTSLDTYKVITSIVENEYPGLCNFYQEV